MFNFFYNFFIELLGSRNKRLLKSYSKSVSRINLLESEIKLLTDEDILQKTNELRLRCSNGESLEDLLPEAFAMVREAAVRVLGLRLFDVQLIGGMALHNGKIAEMRTGEGKTLVATLPAYLNSLTGNGVHIVTVNDYLAQRDSDWMGPVYKFLGLSVGVVKGGQDPLDKREAYKADITYATNNELGFDYLRDNLAFRVEDKFQNNLSFAIVDEVDSILVDEARTPLIISGKSDESTNLYGSINSLVPNLNIHEIPIGKVNDDIDATRLSLLDIKGNSLGIKKIDEALDISKEANCHLVEIDTTTNPSTCQLIIPGDFTVDEKSKQAHLTEEGHEKSEKLLERAGLLSSGESLYDAGNIRLMHHLNSALRAHALFKKEVDYIVKQGEVVIVDEFTGRTMAGRRWSDGLHQAIEAKEGLNIKEENQTVASITFQNYFRLYEKLSGMTGTADTEAFEFQQIYGLEVAVIPTNLPMARKDLPDLVYLTQKGKFDSIIKDINESKVKGQPILVGTTSIETSEYLSSLLKKKNIIHRVLNAKYHEQEAEIVEQAGKPGTVTIATNMAGRGTDIVLGGKFNSLLSSDNDKSEWEKLNQEVIRAGGLHIIGTERHDSRRIDNQLRGRSGRQGDPGSSRFYLSMEDNLMRVFGDPEKTKNLLSRAGMQEDEAIESKILSRQIERAQRKVEAHNFDIRKQLLEYDDVTNDQRKVVYKQRTELMSSENISDAITSIRVEVVNQVIDDFIEPQSIEETWDKKGLTKALDQNFGIQVSIHSLLESDHSLTETDIREYCIDRAEEEYREKTEKIGLEVMQNLEKNLMLRNLDTHWKEHIGALEYLRQGIHLRGYAQKNPKQEYKREAFEMFSDMLDRVKIDTVSTLSKVQIRKPEDVDAVRSSGKPLKNMNFNHAKAPVIASQKNRSSRDTVDNKSPFIRKNPKVGRNEICPECDSGKKYKHCCGK
ncbi:MAG: preprotein translocase subunit SecA [Gammaproteobacteria bacterium TMED78]|nr:MAG: preprotein translocase subunit SecA [Gammaproteobacteria bacterium TMED78]